MKNRKSSNSCDCLNNKTRIWVTFHVLHTEILEGKYVGTQSTLVESLFSMACD